MGPSSWPGLNGGPQKHVLVSKPRTSESDLAMLIKLRMVRRSASPGLFRWTLNATADFLREGR